MAINTLMAVAFLVGVEFGPVQFTGSAQFSFEYDTLNGAPQTRPAMITRWDFNPVLTIYGFPVTMDLSLTSVKNGFLNKVEAFTLTFQPMQLLSHVPSLPGILFAFPMISWGTTNPEFSPLTISGASVEGFTVKYAPGKFYLAVTRGHLADRDSILGEVYQRKTFGYRVGVGAPDGAHLHITYLHFLDDTIGAIVDTNPPRENFLIGLSTGLNFKGIAILQAEIVGSEVTDDIRDSVVNIERVPKWLTQTFKPRISTHLDVAGRANFSIKVKRTSANLYATYTGPGFESFGAPMVRKDALEYGTKLSTSMFKGMISVSGSYKRKEDNLIGTRGETTIYTMGHFDLSVAPPNLPFFQLYFDNSNQTIEDTGHISTSVYGFSAGYPYQIKRMSLYSQISINYQKSDMPDTVYKAQSYLMLAFSQSVALSVPVTFSLNTTYGRFELGNNIFYRKSADFSVSYTYRTLTSSFGTNYISGDRDKRQDVYLRASYRPGWNIMISTTALYGRGRGTNGNTFTEKKLFFIISKFW